MSTVRRIFEEMPGNYLPGRIDRPQTFYFSIGSEKWTVTLHPDRCEVVEGKAVESADCVLKCTPELFERMVLKGKLPGAMDVARGRIKTNNPAALQALQTLFRRP